MSISTPIRMIFPAILMVGLLLSGLSMFTGSAYANLDFSPNNPVTQNQIMLSKEFPSCIQQWKDLINETAQKYEIDPNMIGAVMLQESGGNPEVVSTSGAVGLMQVMPKDGIAASFQCSGKPCFTNRPTASELLDPAFNLDYGARMLANLIENNEGSLREALYQYGPMDVGYAYTDIVLAIYDQYK